MTRDRWRRVALALAVAAVCSDHINLARVCAAAEPAAPHSQPAAPPTPLFLEDGTLVDEAIIRAGWAEAYRRFTYRHKTAFQTAEREARTARRGMWAGRPPP